MSGLSGKWGYSLNQESYYGNFDTKEEAIAECEAGEDPDRDYWVAQFKDVKIQVCADHVIEQVSEAVYEEAGEFAEDWPGKITPEAKKDLEEVLTAVYQIWLAKNALIPNFAVVEESTVEHRCTPKGAA